jgi:hypothetical protein
VLDDETTWGVKVGGEYWAIRDRLAVRAGVWFGSEQGRQEHANYFEPYYGYQILPSAGVGLALGRWDLNATMTVLLKTKATVAQSDNGNPGIYEHYTYLPGISASYHF